MNIDILRSVEEAANKIEIFRAFAQKFAAQLDGVRCHAAVDTLRLHIPAKYQPGAKEKAGDAFGIGGWNQEDSTGHWFKTVDGIEVKILDAVAPAPRANVSNVPQAAFLATLAA